MSHDFHSLRCPPSERNGSSRIPSAAKASERPGNRQSTLACRQQQEARGPSPEWGITTAGSDQDKGGTMIAELSICLGAQSTRSDWGFTCLGVQASAST